MWCSGPLGHLVLSDLCMPRTIIFSFSLQQFSVSLLITYGPQAGKQYIDQEISTAAQYRQGNSLFAFRHKLSVEPHVRSSRWEPTLEVQQLDNPCCAYTQNSIASLKSCGVEMRPTIRIQPLSLQTGKHFLPHEVGLQRSE